MMSESQDILVVRDTAGACYAIPLSEMQGYRLPDALEARAAALLSGAGQNAAWGEVAGYGFMLPLAALFSPPATGPAGPGQQATVTLQSLLSEYKQAEALAESVLKRMHDTTGNVIGKI